MHNHGVVFPRSADAIQAHTCSSSRRPEDAPSAAHTMPGALTARTLPAGSGTPLDHARRLQSKWQTNSGRAKLERAGRGDWRGCAGRSPGGVERQRRRGSKSRGFAREGHAQGGNSSGTQHCRPFVSVRSGRRRECAVTWKERPGVRPRWATANAGQGTAAHARTRATPPTHQIAFHCSPSPHLLGCDDFALFDTNSSKRDLRPAKRDLKQGLGLKET